MFTSKQILTFAYESEYETAYDLSQKKNFTAPKIYTAKGDLSKRWYVYFSFRNPKTGKLKRVTPFYGDVNKYKTKEERMEALTIYRKTLIKLLKLGYNPFQDNTELYNKLNSKKETSETNTKSINNTKAGEKKTELIEANGMPIKEAFEFSLNIKRQLLSKTTTRGYQNRVDSFLKWLDENAPGLKNVNQLNKKVVSAFLNDTLQRTSARNRNNYRTDLSSLMQVLEDNDIIEVNFIKKIPVLKSTPERNKTYSLEIQEAIFKHLQVNDPILLLYIKFISYNFLRPIEVCRLKVKNIDIANRTIQFKAKNSPLKTKIIPEILWNDLPDLSTLDKEAMLFTPDKIGAEWDTDINNKRNYFSKRFKKVVKDHFNLGADYGLYSFRHTYITKLYRALVKESSPFEAKSKLMLITGHTTMTALEKYLRDIDAELPEDYSEMLKTAHE
ncbi:site-specific integrase [Aestuariibaculum sp. YM273]|uniref:tyrosine-type recombinase/integrase n=1 Tax=Aestuariibaculum sp. YM273 TaxID=3070659 RepID=UPI0027DE2A8B|nr:site-specific integrase [Aestuariibaculum sp. YM273]WMI64769.1 site-specific integrase [Aestuariibaculum sp. YM273]